MRRAMDSPRPFQGNFDHHIARINRELNSVLTSSIGFVNDMCRHTLLGHGKRVRPLLFVLSAGLCGYHEEDIYRLSTIFECIHAGSLLHDDVLDNAEMRRSKPTARQVWGNPAAVLGGDFLYTKAMQLTISTKNFDLIEVLNDMSLKMVEGQLKELAKTHCWDLTREEYLDIIVCKTAVLTSAACSGGAVVAGAADETVGRLRDFGLNLGIAFQLIDDVLDYTSCEEQFGKPVGKDLKEGKITLPLIYALSGLGENDVRDLERLFQDQEAGPGDYERILEVVRNSRAVERIRREARDFMARADAALEPFPGSPSKQALLSLNRDLAERSY